MSHTIVVEGLSALSDNTSLNIPDVDAGDFTKLSFETKNGVSTAVYKLGASTAVDPLTLQITSQANQPANGRLSIGVRATLSDTDSVTGEVLKTVVGATLSVVFNGRATQTEANLLRLSMLPLAILCGAITSGTPATSVISNMISGATEVAP